MEWKKDGILLEKPKTYITSAHQWYQQSRDHHGRAQGQYVMLKSQDNSLSCDPVRQVAIRTHTY